MYEKLFRRITRCSLAFLFLSLFVVGIDCAKHMYLRYIVKQYAAANPDKISLGEVKLKLSPFLESRLEISRLDLKGKLLITTGPLWIRMEIFDLLSASLKARSIVIHQDISVETATGRLSLVQFSENPRRIIGDHIELMKIEARLKPYDLPLVARLAVASFDYQKGNQSLTLKAAIPQIFLNHHEEGFGLALDGTLSKTSALNGQVSIRLRNPSVVLDQLVTLKLIKPFEASLLSIGAGLLGGKDKEVPLSIDIRDNSILYKDYLLFSLSSLL
jgi:hypothetical protein